MYKKNILIVITALILSSCNYLDFDESTGLTEEETFGYFYSLVQPANYVYTQISPDWGMLNGALLESATDNAAFTWQDSKVYDICNNTWSAINLIDDKWGHYYRAIRSANLFLEKFSLDQLERFEYSPDYKENIEKAKLYPYEVRFLRAFFYFELAKRYRNIPLLTRTYDMEEINSVEQTPFDDIISFIVRECDDIGPVLPVSHRSFYSETGRATRGAVMALKSRALLYAASPLHNPGNDPKKWEAAATAAHDLISISELERWYSLVPNANLFGNGNNMLTSRELIFEKREAQSSSFEKNNLPIGFEGGNSGNTPTQNLVDAFEMADGTPFDWNNPDHAANPYFNRDPRLAKIVVLNGSGLMRQTVETYVGGKNASPINGATLTGYYLRKYIDESVSLDPVNPVERPHHYVLFRYAEIFLNYAEALNELKGPDYKDATFTISAREAINKIRAYARMPVITGDSDPKAFQTRIRNERRVELAFEDHRFWDIRRWKTGNVVKEIYGITIEKNVTGGYRYTKKVIQNRVWDDKMYLYPIPNSELFINDKLKQNPGW